MHQLFKNFLVEQQSLQYMKNLLLFLKNEKQDGKKIIPKLKDVFHVFDYNAPNKIYVVILGVEPLKESDGLAYSTNSIDRPKIIETIYREIWTNQKIDISNLTETEVKNLNFTSWKSTEMFASNKLSEWSEQGVFLLNILLTAELNIKTAHKKKGWEQFCVATLLFIQQHSKNIVFMLWGNEAKMFKKYINAEENLILECENPSVGENAGWFGNRHFLQANEYLLTHHRRKIRWWILKE